MAGDRLVLCYHATNTHESSLSFDPLCFKSTPYCYDFKFGCPFKMRSVCYTITNLA